MSHQINLLCLVVLTYFCLSVLSANPAQMPGAVPPNPCPNTFSYVKGANGEIEGKITVPFDGKNTSLELKVNCSLKGYHGKKANLTLTLLTPDKSIYYNATQTILYQINFPTQEYIPRVVEIRLNERVYCTGPPEELKLGGPPITQMQTLHHFYFSITRKQGEMLHDEDIIGISRQSEISYIESDDVDA